MRLDTFKSVGRKALGEGNDKKAFVDPREDERVILEIKKDGTGEKYSPRLLKGAFYLNKIAHLLIPNSVPEMYQTSESLDGQQTFDRERIAHTPAHKRLQMDRRLGRDEERSKIKMEREMGSEMQEVDLELERIGLGFSIDSNVANYSRDKTGNVRYLETFMPWGKSGGIVPATSELLFDVETLAEAIKEAPDEKVRRSCELYLERIQALFEEEKKELEASSREVLQDCEALVKSLEDLFAVIEAGNNLQMLMAIQTEEDARKSSVRKRTMDCIPDILFFLRKLETGTTITPERYKELNDRYTTASRAVGIIGKYGVDHTR